MATTTSVRRVAVLDAALVGVLALVASACGVANEADQQQPRSAAPTASASDAAPAPATWPPFTELEPGCLETVAALPEPAPMLVAEDLVTAAATGTIAAMPLPSHEDQQVVGTLEYHTVDEFMEAHTGLIAPEERRAVLERAGFVGSVSASYAYEHDRYGVDVLEFESEQGAREYYDVHVGRICRDAMDLRPLASPAGAVIYDRLLDGRRLPRAVAQMGRYEVVVHVCQCVGVTDLAALSGQWIDAIAQQATSGARA